MKKFLLLRSNKQSGPYSADELQQMGLKPYDLIWVDGKSAAWRYPGEIEELKSFAPPVEEQPYDRFYKKPEQEHKAQESASVETPVTGHPPAQQFQPAEKPVKKEREYKRVFVTLPSGKAAVQPPAQKTASEPVKQQPYQPPVQKPVEQPAEQVSLNENRDKLVADHREKAASDNFISEYYQKKAALDAKANGNKKASKTNEKPATELRSTDAQDSIYYPKKTGFSLKAIPMAAILIGMVAMVAVGVVIGLSINRNSGVSMVKTVEPVPNSNDQQSTTPTESEPEIVNANYSTGPVFPDSPKTDEPANQVKKKLPQADKKTPIALDTNQQELAVNQPVKNEPEPITQKEDETKKPLAKPSVPELEKQISVSSNDYEVGPFGGISKLALTLKNSSGYDLNLVVVQVEYLKVNKEVYKTENLYFRDVAANSSLTLDAPRSNRGNKINYKVTLINSKEHLFHANN